MRLDRIMTLATAHLPTEDIEILTLQVGDTMWCCPIDGGGWLIWLHFEPGSEAARQFSPTLQGYFTKAFQAGARYLLFDPEEEPAENLPRFDGAP